MAGTAKKLGTPLERGKAPWSMEGASLRLTHPRAQAHGIVPGQRPSRDCGLDPGPLFYFFGGPGLIGTCLAQQHSFKTQTPIKWGETILF